MTTSFLIYLATLIGIQTILYGYYRLFLSRQTWFQFNRWYLLSTLVLSALLPLVGIPIKQPLPLPNLSQLEAVVITNESSHNLVGGDFSWTYVFWNVYITGILATVGLFVYRLRNLVRFMEYRQPHQQTPFYTLYHTEGEFPTSSFLRYIFWDETISRDEADQQQILTHECYHIQQGHSWDLLLVEVFQILFWFNPFVYLMRKDLVLTHEFLADRSTTKQYPIQSYAKLILSEAMGARLPFTHTFCESPVKVRIKMLKKVASWWQSISRYAPVFPLVILLGLCTGGVYVAAETSAIATEAEPSNVSTPLAPAIPKPEAVPLPPRFDVPDIIDAPDINQYIVVEEEPKPINMMEIKKRIGYPKEARDSGIQGNVVVRILIDTEGNYRRHVVLNAVHPVLERVVVQHIADLQFEPAIKSDEPIHFWVNVPFSFKLLE